MGRRDRARPDHVGALTRFCSARRGNPGCHDASAADRSTLDGRGVHEMATHRSRRADGDVRYAVPSGHGFGGAANHE